jgi:type VI secretion system secreted protein Hcp
VRKAGGGQLEYLKIKLTDVLISSYKEHASTQKGDENPLEQISLNFSKVEYQYQPHRPDGKAEGGSIVAGWDVKEDVKA